MGWKNIPEIRDLEPYCKKYGYAYIVTFAVHGNHENYTVTTYGKTKSLCKAAAVAGDELKELVQAGTWPNWPEEEPLEPAPDPRIVALEAERDALREVADWAKALYHQIDTEGPWFSEAAHENGVNGYRIQHLGAALKALDEGITPEEMTQHLDPSMGQL